MNTKYLRYDRVNVNADDMALLVEKSDDISVSDMLLTISLPELSIYVGDGLIYSFTASSEGLSLHANNSYEELFDVWVVFTDGGIGFKPKWLNHEWMLHLYDSNYGIKEPFMVPVTIYACLNHLSLHRPEVFTYGEKQVVIPKTIKKNGRYKTINETKLVKVINLNSEELSKRHHNITCPSWGVAGHYRHYKDGKVVFIKSYRKGKKRDDPEAYHPKEYQTDYPNDKQTEVTDE